MTYDIRQMITGRIQSPKIIIQGVRQGTNRLIGLNSARRKDSHDIFKSKRFNEGILDNETGIANVDKLMTQRIPIDQKRQAGKQNHNQNQAVCFHESIENIMQNMQSVCSNLRRDRGIC